MVNLSPLNKYCRREAFLDTNDSFFRTIRALCATLRRSGAVVGDERYNDDKPGHKVENHAQKSAVESGIASGTMQRSRELV